METSAGAAPLRMHVMGVAIQVDVPDEATRARLARQWVRTLGAGPDTGEPAGRVPMPAGGPDDEVARDYALTTQITMAALRATVGHRLNVHAGGLGDPDGRVLALVGPSGSGKTTATRLLAARLAYFSDETVSVGPGRGVLSHAKPLSVVVDPAVPSHKEQLSPDDLGLVPTPASGTLQRLVVLHRGVQTPRGLVRLDTVEGLLELIEQTSSLGLLPDPLRFLLRIVRECGGVWALEYDEIADHLDLLVEHLAVDLPPPDDLPEPIRHAGPGDPPADAGSTGPGSELEDGRVRRLPWVDAVELGPDLVVLLDARAVHLSGLTATIWLSLASPLTVDGLLEAARRIHGDHPDAASIIAAAVSTLADEGLVTWWPRG